MSRIWTINHYADPPEEGKFLRHFNFAKELTERGHQVVLFTASTIHNTSINFCKENHVVEKSYDGIPFVFVPARSYKNLKQRSLNMLDYTFRVQKITKNYPSPDVIYASSPHPFTLWAAKRIAKRSGIPWVAEIRDLWPETFVSMGSFSKNNPLVVFLYALEKSLYKKADHLIFTMPGGADYLKGRGINREGVFYINNGVNRQTFKKQAEEFKATSHEDDKVFNVNYTGAMGRINDLHILLQAAKVLEERGEKGIRIRLYGSGAEEQALRAYAKEENLQNIQFMGRVPKERIPAILSQSHLNIITGKNIPLYRYGMSFNKLFEYMAAEVPILSNLNCNYDIISAYRAGKVVAPDSPEAMAEGILYFKKLYEQDPLSYGNYCRNAKRGAEEFDFKKLTDRLEKALFIGGNDEKDTFSGSETTDA